jgi:hypothetical protein
MKVLSVQAAGGGDLACHIIILDHYDVKIPHMLMLPQPTEYKQNSSLEH